MSTCRYISDGIGGPIPWNQLLDYSRWSELDEDGEKIFIHLMEKLDAAYLKMQREELKKKTSSAKKPQASKGGRSIPRVPRRR